MKLIRSKILSKYGSLCHFTTTRKGGVSKGNYSSFNMGMYSGDSLDDVIENRKRLAEGIDLPFENLFFPYQNHGENICLINNELLNLSKEEQFEKLNGVDALITDLPSVCIGVTTADCVPILLFDPVNRVFAAVHAGWRGTVANIAGKVVSKMTENYSSLPSDIVAFVGPCISKDIFEVGNEVVVAFDSAGFDIDLIGTINKQTNKMHIDLLYSNQILLIKSGLLSSNIELSDICTYKSSDIMYSARRETINSGRILSGGYIID